jgi:hypothetical protein
MYVQASTEISTPASADSTLTSDSHETSLPAVLGMADSAATDEPATSTHGKDDSSNDDFTLTAASSELPPAAEEDLADDELVFHAPSTAPSAVSSSVPSLRSRSRQQVLAHGRDTVAPEQPRRNAPRKLDGFSSTNSNNNNIHSVEGESNEGNVAPSLEAGTRPGISLEQNLFQEVQQSIAAAEPVRTFVGRPLRPVVAPLSPTGVESAAVQSSRSRSRASTPAPTPVELPPSPPPRRPAASRPAQDEEGEGAAAVAAPGGGEYEYEYYYDYLDDSPHSTDYDLVPLSAKVTTTNHTFLLIFFISMCFRYRDVG